MKVLYSTYFLNKKNKLNAIDSGQVQTGALIKVVDHNQNWGVADLCPWPQLQDSPLQSEIKQKGSLYQRAFELALEDLSARKERRSLLQNKWIKNNILVTDYNSFNFQAPQYFGKTLKVKGDQNLEVLLEKLNSVAESIKLRIDFNSSLNEEQYEKFLNSMQVKKSIEYVEDPTPFNLKNWKKWNQKIPLAADFEKASNECFQVKIFKPSRERKPEFKNFTITSSMDHPVGVAHALRFAQDCAQNVSGLLTLDLYEKTPFDRYFIYRNDDEINFAPENLSDFGIGMTAELEKLIWKDGL
jgi:o-succinylbenzoate synthase